MRGDWERIQWARKRRLALKKRRPDIWDRDRGHLWYRDDTILTNGPVEVGRLRAALRALLKIGIASEAKTTREATAYWASNNDLLVHRAYGYDPHIPAPGGEEGKR